MKGVLDGVRVLELCNFIAGPYAAMLLADMGAEVIKVENPKGGDPFRGWDLGGDRPNFWAYNRGKKSITLNLKDPRAMKILLDLVAKADVVIALLLLAVLIGLPMVGIDLTTLSVFGGALGVGLGFGLQKIASNYVSGFIILLDNAIRIGNIITVGPDRGEVTRITTRYTVLRSLGGVEALVPNELLVGSVVQNESYSDPQVRVALPVQVAYDSDLERAMAIMAAAATAQERVLAEPAPVVLLKEFADSGINLELGFWVADPQNGVGPLRSDVNLAIWREFKQAGISIPFPQREVRVLKEAGHE